MPNCVFLVLLNREDFNTSFVPAIFCANKTELITFSHCHQNKQVMFYSTKVHCEKVRDDSKLNVAESCLNRISLV